MSVMIINILNIENNETLLIYTKSSYNDWRKHDSFGHDVTGIGLVYSPICKWTPPPPPPFVNGGSNYGVLLLASAAVASGG